MTYLHSLDKALDHIIEFNFCESDFYFLNGSKNCMVATFNSGSVYTCFEVSLVAPGMENEPFNEKTCPSGLILLKTLNY